MPLNSAPPSAEGRPRIWPPVTVTTGPVWAVAIAVQTKKKRAHSALKIHAHDGNKVKWGSPPGRRGSSRTRSGRAKRGPNLTFRAVQRIYPRTAFPVELLPEYNGRSRLWERSQRKPTSCKAHWTC